MEARPPDAPGTEPGELDPAFVTGYRRVRCFPEHAPGREVTAGLTEPAAP